MIHQQTTDILFSRLFESYSYLVLSNQKNRSHTFRHIIFIELPFYQIISDRKTICIQQNDPVM